MAPIHEANVVVITHLLIKEILVNQTTPDSTLNSVNGISDLFIQSVLQHNVFKEKKYFQIEELIVLDEDFCTSIKDVAFGFNINEESLKTVKDFFSQHESRKFTYEVPYEYITDYIYKYVDDIDYIRVDDKLINIAQAIKLKINDYEDHEKKVLEKVFRKFRRHLLLSVYQKNYISKITKENSIEASEIANTAKIEAGKAKELSNEARILSEKAGIIYDDMMVNYITILGIFASIIITVFGGINLTNATVKLLESEYDVPMMVFIVSFLMIGFISILIVLITWISSLRQNTEYHSAVKWWILGGFSLLSLCSGVYLNHKIKTNADCQIGYYTCLHMDELKEPYIKNYEDNNDQN